MNSPTAFTFKVLLYPVLLFPKLLQFYSLCKPNRDKTFKKRTNSSCSKLCNYNIVDKICEHTKRDTKKKIMFWNEN